MAKRNWSSVEAPHWSKSHANKYAAKVTRYSPNTTTVIVTVDPNRVREAFASKSDVERDKFYQPPIVGKSICR